MQDFLLFENRLKEHFSKIIQKNSPSYKREHKHLEELGKEKQSLITTLFSENTNSL